MRPCRRAARRIEETERKLSQDISEVSGVARAASDAVEVFADSLGWAVATYNPCWKRLVSAWDGVSGFGRIRWRAGFGWIRVDSEQPRFGRIR